MNKDVSNSFESHFGILSFFIISLLANAKQIASAVRGHWLIKNWSLKLIGVNIWTPLNRTSCAKDLEGLGYRVLRIWNNEVFKNIQGVMDSILNLLDTVPHQPPSSPALLPQGRREKGEDCAN
jgi:hypothetical protein